MLLAYKHVFASPSSVEDETKATRSGNARIHGMTKMTPASIAYIATQDGYCDRLRKIHNSVMELLTGTEEKEEIDALLVWWNR
ncbi:hypothetical protein A0H81_10361 [Grifola frondosa]|uniref:Uncharacterized protein n=1 Tax=Grifola frondosa TaxID=5627 RepID=A0A1C7LZN8_GRIFR|nr:hypothetical protein A0H81_10361 [Grifola frondosa]